MVAIDPAVLAPAKLRGLRRREYDRLVAWGVFDGERIELLRGNLVEMTPIDAPHASVTHKIQKRLIRALGDRAEVRSQAPFVASDSSEPEPDIAVVPPGDYEDAHPDRASLVIEVADSSVRKDRALKAAIYAQSQVDEYWIINLADDQVEVFRTPQADGSWRDTQVLHRGAHVTVSAFPDVTLAVDDLLPRKRPSPPTP